MSKKHYLNVKDHSVSGENFELLYNSEYDMLETSPKPEGEKLAAYYESDDYISHTDGKRSVFECIYQTVKTHALKTKISLINSLQPNRGKLLDIGAGTGDFLSTAKASGWETVGFEPSDKARAIASAKNVSFVSDTSELLDSNFDAITMWHVLEHVPDVPAQISELKRLLKPSGVIIIAVPNFKSFDAQHYGEFWAAYDVPRHLSHFSKTAIEKLFSEGGFSLESVRPMWFDAFYVSLLSEKYKNGKMNPLSAMANGLKSNLKGRKTAEFSSHIYVLRPKSE